MATGEALISRAASKCELCGSETALDAFTVFGVDGGEVLACQTCRDQLDDGAAIDVHHWRCLNEAVWSDVRDVQIVSWRMLNRLKDESWARDLLDMMYLDDETIEIAKSGLSDNTVDGVEHRDSNGAILASGDTVSLIKDLPVKGAGFTAKRGTSVRNISLVADNAEHIEGRVDGQQIVILTKFVKKA